MEQNWFELRDIRRRTLDSSVWIPLRCSKTIEREGRSGYTNFKEEYFGIRTLLVPNDLRTEANQIEWTDLSLSSSTKGRVYENTYYPAHIFKKYSSTFIAEHPIMVSQGNSAECSEWLLHPDIITTLNLRFENDTWVAIEYGYEEVVKLERNQNGCIICLSMKANYLKDYLKARDMALYACSYRSRIFISDVNTITWGSNPLVEETGGDRWEGRVTEIHEGGMNFGGGYAFMNVSRTDVDFDEDIPSFDFPTDEVTKIEKREGKFKGKKIYRIEGELWRNEWVNPAALSTIILEEETPPIVSFITDNSGKRETRESLTEGSRWLWFTPSVVNSILSIRGAFMGWYTAQTGNIGCSPGHGVHFGINEIGLINVYAKDIGLLPDWQQQIWVAHNVAPNGKVSRELLMSQMESNPAETLAPEEYMPRCLEDINKIIIEKFGIAVFRDLADLESKLLKIHRFIATDKESLYTLAKDIYKIFGERLEIAIMRSHLIDYDKKWGQLKLFEKLIAEKLGTDKAYNALAPFWAIYGLRNLDSHLIAKADEYLAQLNIDQKQPFVYQGYQLLHSFVSAVYKIFELLDSNQLE